MSSTAVQTSRQTNNNNARPYGRRGRGNRGGRGSRAAPAASVVDTRDHRTEPSVEANNEPENKDLEATTTSSTTDGDQDKSSICWICAEAVKFYSVSECNHRICHECALRLRALYKKQECAFCKHPQPSMVFTASADKPFAEYDLGSMTLKDAKLSIYFETEEMMEDTFIKLRYNCPDTDCEYFASSGWNDLKAHVRAVHSKSLCELCIRFKKVFVHEHTLYTRNQLLQHMPSLSHRPGSHHAKAQAEGGVHPMCEFCKECYFGDDELFVHMRERHEECFICKKAGIRDQYFRNYESLEDHFRSDHYPCTQTECLAKKFVVFGSSMDLQAHMMDEHGTTMSARDKKEARRVVAEFDYDEIPGSGGRRRREREPPPTNQTAPRPNRRDGFGSALTGASGEPSVSTQQARSNVAAPEPVVTMTAPRTPRQSPPPSEPVDPEIAQRHTIFVSRFNALTNGSSSALQAVKASIRSYRASESSARDLITTVHNILEQDLNKTSTIVGNIADILDDEEKRSDLLSSLNGFKVEQRNQFPDLVPIVQGSAYSGVASGRALNMKHATAARSSTRVWDRVAQAAGALPPRVSGPQAGSSSSTERFPALAGSSTIMNTPAYRQAQRSTPWSSTSAASAAAAGSAITSRISSETRAKSSKGSAAPSFSNAAFPSLPTVSARNKPTVSGNQSLKNIVGNSAPATNAWAGGGGGSSSGNDVSAQPEAETQEGVAEAGGGKGKKKKGKEKVTLFTLGTHAMSRD